MIKLELADQMVAVIGECLGNGPHKIVAPVIAEIQRQIDEQQPKLNGAQNMTQVALGPVNITQGNSAQFFVEYFDSANIVTTPSCGVIYITYLNTSNVSTTDTVSLTVVGSFFTGTWSSTSASLGLADWIVVSAGSTTTLQEGIIRVMTP